MADAELDWKLPHGGLYGFPSPAGIFAAFSMPGENRYRIFGNFPPGPEGPSAEYSEPTHEEFQAMVDERRALPRQGRQGVLGDPLPGAQPHRAALPRRAGIPRRRRRPRAQPRRRTRHEHRHSGRLQPGLEARPGRTRPRRRVVTGQLSGRAAPGRRPVAEDDRPVVLGLRRAEPTGAAGPRPGGAAAGQPCADSPVGPPAVHRPVGATARSLPGQPAQRRGRFGLAGRARTGRPGPRGRRDHRRATRTPTTKCSAARITPCCCSPGSTTTRARPWNCAGSPNRSSRCIRGW